MTNRLRFALVSLALLTGSAVAGPKQEAKKHIDKATKLHKDGKFADALVELKAAYKLDPKPDLLFAMGQMNSKLGNCADATEDFQKFGKAKKNKKVDEVVDEAIKACKPAEPDALVQPTGPTGPTAPTEQTTPAPPFSEPLGTKPAEPAPPPTPPPTPPPEPTPPSPIVVAPPPVVPPPARHHWYQDKIGDAMVGIGGLAIIGGIIEYSSATSDLDAAEKASTISGYDSKLDEAHSARTMSLAFGIGGAVLVGGGIIHYMVTGHSAEQPAVSAAPTRGGALITWSGGF